MLKFALYLILHQLICKFFFYFIYDSTRIKQIIPKSEKIDKLDNTINEVKNFIMKNT